MKKGIHPENYRLVVFKDMSNDNMILTKSCAATKETVTYTDGNEYP
ncbi:MAG: 50S ribosomal protein L31, partial [Bacteroidales bacterium]|nr:50S ribosomal protein L31 [Bacteroidales bacterium]